MYKMYNVFVSGACTGAGIVAFVMNHWYRGLLLLVCAALGILLARQDD